MTDEMDYNRNLHGDFHLLYQNKIMKLDEPLGGQIDLDKDVIARVFFE